MGIFDDMPYGIKEIITNRMIAAAGVSPAGALIPLLDTAAITGIWGNMLYEIAKYHDVTLTGEECTKIITATGSSILGYLGGSKALNWLLNFIPGVGTLGAMAGNVVFNGYYTFAIGTAFHQMLKDYDINGKTIYEIAKILVHLFVPIPSVGDLKEIYHIIKDHIA
jgi:uncharacterized protein (DUF697 family)